MKYCTVLIKVDKVKFLANLHIQYNTRFSFCRAATHKHCDHSPYTTITSKSWTVIRTHDGITVVAKVETGEM